MKAISLWQPWSSLWLSQAKIHETRHWSTAHRGPLLVHAAKRRMDKDDVEWWHLVSKSDAPCPLGVFVCTARLSRVIRAEVAPFDEYGDYGEGRFAWHLTDVEQLDPPIPAIGRQGFWSWTP